MGKQAGQGTKPALSEHISALMVIKGIVISYVVTIPLFVIFATVLANIDFPENFIGPAVDLITIIGIMAAGFYSTRGVRSRGWLNGSIVGIIYMLILYILSSIVFKDFGINGHILALTILGILAGSVGGIVGINVKRSAYLKPKRGT